MEPHQFKEVNLAGTQRTITMDQLKEHLLLNFFQSLTQDERRVGLELEIIPLMTGPNGGAQTVPLSVSNGTGVVDFLRDEDEYGWFQYAPGSDGAWRFVDTAGGQITFEPGGQIEYSSNVHKQLYQVVKDMTVAFDRMGQILGKHGIRFLHSGLNPFHSIHQVGLQIPKERYQHMNRYFEAIGPFGQKMMRLSGSLQVNLDVGYVEQARRRWLASNLLAPVMCAIFGNSPFHEGKPTGFKSYRAKIWQNLDPSRTGFQKGFEAVQYQACPIEQYLNFALDACCMWLPNQDGKTGFDGNFRTFRHWMDCGFHGLYPDFEDWKKHLTTLFPEVRPRGFYEIRYLDGPPKAFWMVPGVVLLHLLYDEAALEEVISLLSPYRTTLTPMMLEAACKGLEEKDLLVLSKKIFETALKAASKTENQHLLSISEIFFKNFTHQGLSPADELYALNQGKIFGLDDFWALDQKHEDLVKVQA